MRSIIDPAEIRWVWLTHDDADHTGNLERVMSLAPAARLTTHGLGALRMATWWPVPFDRVCALRPGDRVDVGDRRFRGQMATWAAFDAPWTHLVDRERFQAAAGEVAQLRPTAIFSSHLPAASGQSIDQFVKVIESVPAGEPFVPPDQEAFDAIVAGLGAST